MTQNKNRSCQPIGSEMKLEHGPAIIKRVLPARSEGWINFHIFIFFINFVFLITKLFSINNFELKIYDFTLNNVIKIFYINFFAGSCRAGLIGPTIEPSRA
jgi:hypothetical protein